VVVDLFNWGLPRLSERSLPRETYLSFLFNWGGLVRRKCGGDPAIGALWNVYPVECLPRAVA